MTEVVVLSWDSTARRIEFVEVNGGSGGPVEGYVVGTGFAADVDRQCADSGLPRVAELVTDDDGACDLELSETAAVLCSVRWRKVQGQPRVRLTPLVGGTTSDVEPDRVGLGDPDLAQQADRIGQFLLFTPAPQGRPIGCWVRPGGLAGWVEEKRVRREQRVAERAATTARKNAEEARAQAEKKANESFVNPYTFVPFPAAISRTRPAGHHALGPQRLSGAFQVRWEFMSPLQAPEGATPGGRLRLPGASVKGAVRSLHETLAGGCLRVFDREFVPSYRDSATVPPPVWRLAVVADTTDDGQPRTVRVCDTVVWVRAERLHEAWSPRELATGRRVAFDRHEWTEHLGRLELDDDVTITRDGDWVVLLSEPGARPPMRKSKDGRSKVPGTYFAACGRLTSAEPVEVDEQAWRTFRRAVAGAREVQARRRGERDGQQPDTAADVEYPKGKLIGRRKKATGWFDVGDVLWVRTADNPPGVQGQPRVDGLRLAVIWRHVGSGAMGERVPPHLHACDDPTSLCPSCRLFGAADTDARELDAMSRQRAYAGHVRFGDAVSPAPLRLQQIMRAPMGAPRAGAGQVYLRYDDPSPATRKTDPPTREWGAVPDRAAPRQLRGRKYYWHADPTAQSPPRHEARDHQITGKLATERLLAPPGTVLVQRVTFDNLSRAELGGLLATFEPQRVLLADGPGRRQLRLYLGGGKPLGLGSCQASVEELRVWTADSRYGGAPAVAPDPDGYIGEFRDATPPEVRATWPALTAVLADDSVDPKLVSYPPGAFWDERAANLKDFDEPFEFFKVTAGNYLKNGSRPMCPLPEPTDADLTLPIIPKTGRGRNERRGRG